MLSEMIRLHPRVLSVSEWFTVLGERSALGDEPIPAEAYWRLLTVPSSDAVELLRRHPLLAEVRVPEELMSRAASTGIAPVLLIPLPHLDPRPEDLLRDLHAYILGAGPQALSAWHATTFSFLVRRNGKITWVERSGGSLAYVDALNHSWGDARYIHIHRDGVACAQSMSEHPYFRVRVARAVARAPLPVTQCLDASTPLEQFGAYWSAIVSRGLRVLGQIARDDVLHVSYEGLLEQPVAVLRRVQHFLEGPVEDDDWIATARRCIRPKMPRSDESPSTVRLRRACRTGMNALAGLECDAVC
jgi:hypothetical protein